MQVDPSKPTLKALGTKRLKLQCDELLSRFPFKFKMRRYSEALRRYITDHHHHNNNNKSEFTSNASLIRQDEEEAEAGYGPEDGDEEAHEMGVYAARELLAMFLTGRSGHPNVVGFLGWYCCSVERREAGAGAGAGAAGAGAGGERGAGAYTRSHFSST